MTNENVVNGLIFLALAAGGLWFLLFWLPSRSKRKERRRHRHDQ